MAKYAWLACPTCGGVYVRLTNPDFQPIDGVTPLRAEDHLALDGTPYPEGSSVEVCQTCGQGAMVGSLFVAERVRRGDALPERKGA